MSIAEAAAYLPAGILLASALLKLADAEILKDWLRTLYPGLPENPTAWAVIGVELAVVATVLVIPGAGVASMAAFLLVATIVLVISHRRGLDCGCFGSLKNITMWSYLRNIAMLGAVLSAFFTQALSAPQEQILLMISLGAMIMLIIRAVETFKAYSREVIA